MSLRCRGAESSSRNVVSRKLTIFLCIGCFCAGMHFTYRQIDISGGKKTVVINVPYRLRKAFRKIHPRLVRELEKKLSGKEVVIVAMRRIVRPPKKGSAAQRPRTRTLTVVHEAMLEDIVYPAEIVGKRVKYRLDGSKIMKVLLDPNAKNDIENKMETFAGVYRKLSGKDVVFEFPTTEVWIPNMYNMQLWETSGHAANFKENMFVFKVNEQEFGVIKEKERFQPLKFSRIKDL